MTYRSFIVASLACLMAVSFGLLIVKGDAVAGFTIAAKSSPWVQAHHTRVRLIAGVPRGSGAGSAWRAGIHIEMDPGWKTYWRTPGGAGGVPPYFVWDGSTNIARMQINYPGSVSAYIHTAAPG